MPQSDMPSVNPSAKIWTKDYPLGFTSLKLLHRIYDHPTTRKATTIAASILGAAALATAAFGAATLALPVGAIVGLTIAGTLILSITYAAARVLNCLIPMRHDMKNLSFTPDKLLKNDIVQGELYYDGLVPILKINTSDPKEAGYTQGYLLQKVISKLRNNVEFALFFLKRDKRPSEIQMVLDEVKKKIPERFLLELEGVVEGYNAKKGKLEKALNLNDLLYLQLMPDSTFFKPENFLTKAGKQSNATPQVAAPIVGCTVLGLKDQNSAPLVARTMDWPSFGVAGTYSLILSRLHENGTRTAEVGIPGLTGVLTGVNNHGVTVAMNVTGYVGKVNSIEGIPSCFYNRMILEECASFDDAQKFIDQQQAMGPYHLTVSDPVKSGTFSLYQENNWQRDWNKDKQNGYKLRTLGDTNPLITTNSSCTPYSYDMFNGQEREYKMNEYLNYSRESENRKELLKNTQSLPLVNNLLTTHRVLLGHETLEVAFDNAWAGDRDLHTVDLKKLFTA